MSIVDVFVSPLVKTANFIRNGFHAQPVTVQHRTKDGHVLTELEAQWMDPHKRKILETIEDFLDICKDNSYETSSPLVIETLHKICLLCYSANDFELIHKAQDIFPILISILQNVNTPYALRLQIVSAVSILCHGNQVNCRTWCSKGTVALTRKRSIVLLPHTYTVQKHVPSIGISVGLIENFPRLPV